MSRTMLMCRRGTGDAAEAEPVFADLTDGMLTLELDDGDHVAVSFDDLLGLADVDEDEHVRAAA